MLLIIARPGLEVTVLEKFILQDSPEIARGESKYKVLVMVTIKSI